MKNSKILEKSLENNHFHPLNFFGPTNIRQIKPYEVMPDSTVVSVFVFYSETQDKDLFLKVSTNESREYIISRENFTYMMDRTPNCMLKKHNSFSFTEKNGRPYYYSVFQTIEMTLDDFISERLDSWNLEDICTSKNSVNPSFINPPKNRGSMPFRWNSPEPVEKNSEGDLIKEDELIYLWKDIIYAFADLQRARICHRDIRPDNIAVWSIEEFENFENRKTDYSNNTNERQSNIFNRNPRGSNIESNYGPLALDGMNSFRSIKENSRYFVIFIFSIGKPIQSLMDIPQVETQSWV